MDFKEISKVAHAKLDKLLLELKDVIETDDEDLVGIKMYANFNDRADRSERIDIRAWRATCEVLDARGIEGKKDN